MAPDIRTHEWTDRHDEQSFASRKIEGGLCELGGKSPAAKRRWHLGVIEHQPMGGIIVISKEGDSL